MAMVLDIISTPTPKMVQFPSMDQITKTVAERNEKAMKWKELPEMTPFYVKKLTVVDTKNGPTWILSLINETGDFDKKVWTCSGLMKKDIEQVEGKFVVNTGPQQSSTSRYQYYGYLLMD